jgi:putative flippase GtrA
MFERLIHSKRSLVRKSLIIWASKGVSTLLRSALFRFGLVGLISEVLFFIIYGIILSVSSNNTSLALAIAGVVCIVINSYAHSRVTFRVRFHFRLLVGYLVIQLTGYAVAYAIGIELERLRIDSWIIAIIAYSVWTALSFILTQTLFLKGKGKEHPK